MKTYVACIGEEAVLAFRAENDDDAYEMIDDEEGSIRSDLLVLVGADEKPLWDGKSAIHMREATALGLGLAPRTGGLWRHKCY
jgi:hypothetical protein